jgi:hypothetical protein
MQRAQSFIQLFTKWVVAGFAGREPLVTITFAILCISLVSFPSRLTPSVPLCSSPDFQLSENPRHAVPQCPQHSAIAMFACLILTMSEIN